MKLQRLRMVGSLVLVLFVLIFIFVRARHLLFR
jgi:hypothetical protein